MTQVERIKAILLSLLTVAIIFILIFVLMMSPFMAPILLFIFCIVGLTILWYNCLDNKDKDKEEED